MVEKFHLCILELLTKLRGIREQMGRGPAHAPGSTVRYEVSVLVARFGQLFENTPPPLPT